MLSLAFSAAMLGIEGYVVRVEADSAAGSPYIAIIGLPDRALGEARERVRAAILNSGFAYPAGRLLVNLSPADVRKAGPAFDLAIALALIGIDEQVERTALLEFIALGVGRQAATGERNTADGDRRTQRRLQEADRSRAQCR
jgi:magnesium chelatase family protein